MTQKANFPHQIFEIFKTKGCRITAFGFIEPGLVMFDARSKSEEKKRGPSEYCIFLPFRERYARGKLVGRIATLPGLKTQGLCRKTLVRALRPSWKLEVTFETGGDTLVWMPVPLPSKYHLSLLPH